MPDHTFVFPGGGLFGRAVGWTLNNRSLLALRRATVGRMPFVKLQSDVRDVVYLNWVVPTELAAPLVPDGVRLASRDGRTILTVLTYRHGNFGPAFAGPLRRAFPSPGQSNWRYYVDTVRGQKPAVPTILFIRNVFDSALYTAGTRLFSDALQAHLAHTFEHSSRGDSWATTMTAGGGSAPELAHSAIAAPAGVLPAEFAPFYGSWQHAVEALTLQDAALSAVPGLAALAEAGIDLPIDTATIVPLATSAYAPGALLRSLGATDQPFCFCVPRVKFRVLWERLSSTSA